jgi:hypothetical protein
VYRFGDATRYTSSGRCGGARALDERLALDTGCLRFVPFVRALVGVFRAGPFRALEVEPCRFCFGRLWPSLSLVAEGESESLPVEVSPWLEVEGSDAGGGDDAGGDEEVEEEEDEEEDDDDEEDEDEEDGEDAGAVRVAISCWFSLRRCDGEVEEEGDEEEDDEDEEDEDEEDGGDASLSALRVAISCWFSLRRCGRIGLPPLPRPRPCPLPCPLGAGIGMVRPPPNPAPSTR